MPCYLTCTFVTQIIHIVNPLPKARIQGDPRPESLYQFLWPDVLERDESVVVEFDSRTAVQLTRQAEYSQTVQQVQLLFKVSAA